MNRLVVISFIVVFLVITILSLMPPKSGLELPTNDKLGHFLAYSTFSFNACILFSSITKKMILLLLAIVFYGIVIEFIQAFIGRESSFYDFIANLSGVLIGFLLYLLFGKKLRQLLGLN